MGVNEKIFELFLNFEVFYWFIFRNFQDCQNPKKRKKQKFSKIRISIFNEGSKMFYPNKQKTLFFSLFLTWVFSPTDGGYQRFYIFILCYFYREWTSNRIAPGIKSFHNERPCTLTAYFSRTGAIDDWRQNSNENSISAMPYSWLRARSEFTK